MKWISLFSILFSALVFADTKVYKTPTKLADSNKIFFSDDLNFENLNKAIERQLLRLKQIRSLNIKLQFGSDIYSSKDLERSLKVLRDISLNFKNCKNIMCQNEFSQIIRDRFNVYRPSFNSRDVGYGRSDFALFTSYYSPDFDGSFTKTDTFKHAIYSKPNGRSANSTRVQIDFDHVLKGKGLELFYVKQPLFDIYLLHIEGGGRVKVKNSDGSIKYYYLSYTGNNRQRLTYIYRYMKEKGYLRDDFSIKAQREFLNQNPHKQREIFETTPSYVYFKVTDDEPLGVENIPLTEKRSAAVDRRYYGIAGLLMFVQATAPNGHVLPSDFDEVSGTPFSRFFIAQDTGGAIKGKARVDLYSGFGENAELWANYMKSYGKLYFLMLKPGKWFKIFK